MGAPETASPFLSPLHTSEVQPLNSRTEENAEWGARSNAEGGVKHGVQNQRSEYESEH